MKKFDEVQFNKEAVRRKGFDYFAANVKDLVSRGLIGYKDNGKVVTPSDAEIKAKFEELTGIKIVKEAK